MNRDVSAFVERYQILYEKDPDSKVFAPLAEAYRRMGLLDEAIDLAENGVAKHPYFASGRVALGRCLVQKGDFLRATEQLKTAVDLSPENLLAHQLLAECYARLNKKAEALNAYKMVLFLNPSDEKVAAVVRNLETQFYQESSFTGSVQKRSLTPPIKTEPEEEFSMERLNELAPLNELISTVGLPDPEELESIPSAKTEVLAPDLERELALLDTRFDRGNWEEGRAQLIELAKFYPEHPEVTKRQQYLDELTQSSSQIAEWLSPISREINHGKVHKLEKLLERIQERRKA